MRERFPSIVALCIMITLTVTTWLTSRWLESSIAESNLPRMTHEMDAFADNFLFVRSNPEGYPITRIQGVRLEHYPDDASFDIWQPLATQQSPVNPQMFAASEKGKLFDENSQLLLSGQARFWRPVTEAAPLLEVTSQSFLVLLNHDIVQTNDSAIIIHGDSKISGTGMRYNNIERSLSVLNQSRVEINSSSP